jgi:hypothetical protein
LQCLGSLSAGVGEGKNTPKKLAELFAPHHLEEAPADQPFRVSDLTYHLRTVGKIMVDATLFYNKTKEVFSFKNSKIHDLKMQKRRSFQHINRVCFPK